MSIFDKNLALPTTLTDLLEARNAAIRSMESARRLIEQAEADLKVHGTYLWPRPASFNGGHEHAIRDLDTSLWRRAFDLTGFRQIMDQEAVRDFERSLEKAPPAFTEETIRATFLSLHQEADAIFRRGIVNVFRTLSKDYRTNEKEPFRVGDKVIMDYMVSADWGLRISYSSHASNKLDDIDRVFKTVAGEPFHPRSLETAINGAFKKGDTYEDAYYKARGFKKGSLHLWFKRADLLEKVNDLIAEHYGSNTLAA